MCLAVPARVKELREGATALVDLGGMEMEVRVDLVPEVTPGMYVIVHAGFAINTMDEEEARENLELLGEAADERGEHPES